MLRTRQIISIDDLSEGDIGRLFFRAKQLLSADLSKPTLSGRQIVLAFFEPSTRTKLSFAMAAGRLGVAAVNFDVANSSQKKGESLSETLATIAAMRPDALVVRQSEKLNGAEVASLGINVVNAGDGVNEHPTQALLDCFTLLERWQCANLCGRKILIVGDVHRSRVFHSNLKLMRRLGAQIKILSPSVLLTSKPTVGDADFHNFESISEKFDAVMILRVQEERMAEQAIDRQNYFARYGLNFERFLQLGPDCLLLHPGPMLGHVEIDASLANHERSLIRMQVRMGVLIRAAVLDLLLGNEHA